MAERGVLERVDAWRGKLQSLPVALIAHFTAAETYAKSYRF